MKDKKLYYECIATCQMGFMGPDQRKERWEENGMPAMCLHERSFYPSGLGKKRPDYLATDKPISKRYLQPVMRTFSKMDLRTREMKVVNSPTTAKFRLLDSDEIGDYVREHARFLVLRDVDLEVTDKDRIEQNVPEEVKEAARLEFAKAGR
jgi:hypothetical protein